MEQTSTNQSREKAQTLGVSNGWCTEPCVSWDNLQRLGDETTVTRKKENCRCIYKRRDISCVSISMNIIPIAWCGLTSERKKKPHTPRPSRAASVQPSSQSWACVFRCRAVIPSSVFSTLVLAPFLLPVWMFCTSVWFVQRFMTALLIKACDTEAVSSFILLCSGNSLAQTLRTQQQQKVHWVYFKYCDRSGKWFTFSPDAPRLTDFSHWTDSA